MVIGSKYKPSLKIGELMIETTNKYKYSGEIIHKNCLSNTISLKPEEKQKEHSKQS
jgi:hypothetical protein